MPRSLEEAPAAREDMNLIGARKGDHTAEIYVDEETIAIGPDDQIYGNWRSTPQAACEDKGRTVWFYRKQLGFSEVVLVCTSSAGMVSRFDISAE
ncbi:hypothetical protein GCM10007923_55520 [Shinella yambaruensis]|uniref:Uncharacterized protein n=1 Tax=Shinella yambaruensis TaxID=415996 RepID=A0ABQ5ZSJ5_9HYPH|nr:hypothetical protein GCM10007923_55520 [Shinella yambaruensis]